MSEGQDRYCFIHLPKCAGTSVLRFLQAAVGESNVLHLHAPGAPANAPIEYLLGRYRVLVGHYEVSDLPAWMFERVFMFTFLRDPVERVLSNYQFYRNVPHDPLVPEMIRARKLELGPLLSQTDLSRPNVWSNWQTFALSGISHRAFKPGIILEPAKRTLDKLGFVGFHERLNSDVKRLSEMCGWDPTIPLPAANVTPNRKGRDAIDPETLSLLRELNRDDIELYKYATALVPKARPSVPSVADSQNPWTRLPFTALARRERGTREIAIVEITVRGSRSQTDMIEQGDDMEIALVGESTIDCSNFVAGIRITDPYGEEVYGTNTLLIDGPITLERGRRFSVAFCCAANMALGTYYITAAFHTADDREFHWFDNHSVFACAISSQRTCSGCLDLKAKVKTTLLPMAGQ